MGTITPEAMTALLAAHEGPCLSIYQPTQRSYPDNQQGPIRYRNLLRKAEEQLKKQGANGTLKAVLEKATRLADDPHFWTRRQDGLAVFASPSMFQTFDLQRGVEENVVVAESFHVKPLLRRLQTADRYQVLCLTRTHVRMLEGNRDALDEIELKGVPATIEEALGAQTRESKLEQAPGGNSTGERRAGGANQPALMVDHPAHGDVAKQEAERFFRVIDRALWENHSRPTGLPLILAALPENQPLFRGLSRNQHLLPDGIFGNPDMTALAELRQAAWKLVEPHHHNHVRQVIDIYQASRVRGLATDQLGEAFRQARIGRVGTVLIDADLRLPGTIDPQTGEPRYREDADDLLDDVGELVLRMKGTVLVLPGEVMPTRTGLAAIYRY